ncbi:hypothetical protein OC844_005406 [Tilletia horrida]|nr:hypothetical protein OC844_005406 [Tilletia horrida]
MPGFPHTMQRPPYVPKLHSSQIRTKVAGRTYESQIGLCIQIQPPNGDAWQLAA